MTDISRHIEYLLLEHDVVTVPQWGTFRIRQTDSRWVAEEDLFLPPVRNVSFASDLVSEAEDCFVRSLAASLRVTREQALAACAEYVESMRQELAANSVVEVGSIGMFVRDAATGTDCFVPCQAGVTSPAFYGLDAVYQPRLPEHARQTADARQTAAASQARDDKHVTIRIPRSLLYYVSAAAAAIIIFLSFSTPALYTSPESGATVATANLFLPANLLPSGEDVTQPVTNQDVVPASKCVAAPVASHDKGGAEAQPQQAPLAAAHATRAPAPQPVAESAAHTSKPDTAPSKATDEPVAPAPSPATPAEASQPEYAVVLASAVTTANAERYVRDLNSRGIKAEMRARGNMTRVLVPGFRSQDEAGDYARQLRAQGSEFDAAWVLKF